METKTSGTQTLTNTTKNMVCLWGRSGMGKSATLLDLIPLFHNRYHCLYKVIWANPNDITLVIDIEGFRVGINTMGDPGYGMKTKLEALAFTENCQLIICSCRTKGSTAKEVQDVAQAGAFNLIWTTNFNSGNSHNALNKLSAENLFRLLEKLIPLK